MKVVARRFFWAFSATALLLAGCSSEEPADTSSGSSSEAPAADDGSGWTEQDVDFDAGGLTIYGTYRHKDSDAVGPAALLISESGQTDRNGDNNVAGPIGNMRQLAELLSERGLASLRYDKIGTGKTGLGPYQTRPAEVVSSVYTEGAQSAVRFLADEPATDPEKISVYALGEGTVHAMNLAASGDPRIHSLALLQPLPGRYLDLITTKLQATVDAGVKEGSQTQQDADSLMNTWRETVTEVREKGTVPADLPQTISLIVNPGNVLAVKEADAVDPVALAAKLAPGTPVLLTCSDVDLQANCDDMQPLIDALGQTDLQVVKLSGVNHVLQDDPTDNPMNYASGAPLSDQLVTALDTFATK